MKKIILQINNTVEKYVQLFEKKELWHITILALLSVLVFTYQIGKESLWLDEVYTYFASNTWQNLVDTISWKEKNMWTYHILMYFWKFIGSGEVVMRSLSVVFSVLGVITLYKLGKELQSRILGFVSGTLLLLNIYYVQYAQEARGYSMFAFLFILSTLYLIKYMRTGKKSHNIAYVAITILAIYTHLYAIFFIPIQAVFMFAQSLGSKKKIVSTFVTYFFIALGFLPLLLAYILSNASTVVTRSKGALSWIPYADFYTFLKHFKLMSSNSGLVMTLYFFLLGLLFVFIVDVNKKNVVSKLMPILYLTAIAFIPTTFMILFSIFIKPLFVTRYFIFTLPAFIMLIAFSLTAFNRKIATCGLFIILILLHINMLRIFYATPLKEQWKEVLVYLEQNKKPGDKVVIFPQSLSLPVQYYLENNPKFKENDFVIAFPKDLKEYPHNAKQDLLAVEGKIKESETIWVITREQNLPITRGEQKELLTETIMRSSRSQPKVHTFNLLRLEEYKQ